jgi:hypothetical protein
MGVCIFSSRDLTPTRDPHLTSLTLPHPQTDRRAPPEVLHGVHQEGPTPAR